MLVYPLMKLLYMLQSLSNDLSSCLFRVFQASFSALTTTSSIDNCPGSISVTDVSDFLYEKAHFLSFIVTLALWVP